MKILLVSGHPNKDSFCHSIYDTITASIDRQKHEVEVVDLAEAEFDPVLRYGYQKRMVEDSFVKRSQELIQWADHLIFVYPIWWSSMPSNMKGWIDRVFTPGIAYKANPKGNFILNFILGRQFDRLLKGKTASIYATSQAPSWWYKLFSGPISVPDSYGIAVLKNAVLSHCGVKTKRVRLCGNMDRDVNTVEVRQAFLEKVRQDAARI